MRLEPTLGSPGESPPVITCTPTQTATSGGQVQCHPASHNLLGMGDPRHGARLSCQVWKYFPEASRPPVAPKP